MDAALAKGLARNARREEIDARETGVVDVANVAGVQRPTSRRGVIAQRGDGAGVALDDQTMLECRRRQPKRHPTEAGEELDT